MAGVKLECMCFSAACGRHVLIALSGGADSVALLHSMAQRRSADRLRITAAHFNHHIRGKDADNDQRFCESLCREMDIPLIIGGADIPALAKAQGCGIETAAREARHAFLEEARRQCGAELIALAHHADDQAETVLMHLLRGAGPEGICGMREISGNLYRPLLAFRKAELEAYLKERGIAWREDSTNFIADTPRNALRLNVLPEIERNYPQAVQAAGRYALTAQIESDYLSRKTDDFLKTRRIEYPFGTKIVFSQKPEEAILRRAIRGICGDGPDFDKLEALIALAGMDRGRLEISGRLYAEKTASGMYFIRKDAEKPLPVPLTYGAEIPFSRGMRIFAEETCAALSERKPGEEFLDAEKIQNAVIRARMDGDRIHPLGASGERLLSDYLSDKKIERPLRDFLPLLAIGRQILWVGGIGIAENAKITSETRRRLRIRIITDEPTEVQE